MGLTMENQTYTYKYPHPALTADCVVFGFDGQELRVLLIERDIDPYKGRWALPGGFVRIDETVESCAQRELEGETGLHLAHLEQLKVFSGVDRDPRERVVTVAFYALARNAEVRGGDDARNAQWFSLTELPSLAFDHETILSEALERIKQDIHFHPVGFDLLGDTFTMPQLQRLYEAILGVQFDRRNFHKKMLQLGILEQEEDEKTEMENVHRFFFGESREMCSKSINELFVEPQLAYHARLSCDASVKSTGRKGKKYRFNKEKYDLLKEKGISHFEF